MRLTRSLRSTLISTAVALTLGGIASAAIAAPRSAAPESAPADGPRDLSGVWWVLNYEPTLVPADGGPVPYTEVGKAEADKNLADIKAGVFDDPAVHTCLLQGLPRAMISAYPMKIVQHERTATFIHEQNHAFWHSIIGIPHAKLDDVDLAFMGGESVSKWDGDTLVVDTIAFKAKSYLDDMGMPHTEDLHLVQRLRKIDGGKKLEDLIIIDDPKIFTKPWVARRTYEWRPDVKIMEYVCGDPKRALTGDRAKALRLNWKPL